MRLLILLVAAGGLAACAMPSSVERALLPDDCFQVAENRTIHQPAANEAYSARFRREYAYCMSGQTMGLEPAPTSPY